MEVPKPTYVHNPYRYAKIYRVVSAHTDKVYYGSTTKELKNRLQIHQKHFEMYNVKKYPNYIAVFEIIKYGDVIIELVEEFPCQNKYQIGFRERQWMLLDDNRCNIRLPGKVIEIYNSRLR